MRHRKRTAKIASTNSHSSALLANLACSLIKHNRVTTTLAKAKALRPVVEKLVTLGKRSQIAVFNATTAIDQNSRRSAVLKNVHFRRLAAAKLKQQSKTFFHGTKDHPGKTRRLRWRQQQDVVHILFDRIAPVFKERKGGYTRIVKLSPRRGDAAMMAIIEWVDAPLSADIESASNLIST